MQRVKLLNFDIDTLDFESAVNFAKESRGQVVTINPEMIEYASSHPEFADIIRKAELVIPDGIGVQIGLKITGADVKRIAGIEFARRLLDGFAGQPVALIGAKPHVIAKTAANLKFEIPDINIVYQCDGYFQDDAKVLNEVAAAKPRLVLAALGSPKQEEFLFKLKPMLPDALMIGIGGSFDVWAGEVSRAPGFYRKMGLEWLYRAVKEPKRFRRIFPALPLFMLKVLKEKWSK